MLNKETMDYIKSSIKEINRTKIVDDRLDKMIDVKENLRGQFNDVLDDIFSVIDLRKIKVNLEE